MCVCGGGGGGGGIGDNVMGIGINLLVEFMNEKIRSWKTL